MSHALIDKRSLELNRLVAEKIRRQADLMDHVRNRLKQTLSESRLSESCKKALREWQIILLTRTFDKILDILVGDSDDGQRRLQGFLPRMNEWRFFVIMNRQAFEHIVRATAGDTGQKDFNVIGSQLEERAARTSNHKIFPPGPMRPCRLASSASLGARRHRRLDHSNHAFFFRRRNLSDPAGNPLRKIRNLPAGFFWSYVNSCPQSSPP